MAKRKMAQASLDNLKSGSIFRRQGKIRLTLSVLPGTRDWLKKRGNASERTDELVRRILNGDLAPRWKLERLEAEIEALLVENQKLKYLLSQKEV
jgi:hypothetical protein